jgi:hypothetical protein
MSCQESSWCLPRAANTPWLEHAFDDDGLWTGGVVQVLRDVPTSRVAPRDWRGRLTSISRGTKHWLLAPVGFPLQLPSIGSRANTQ